MKAYVIKNKEGEYFDKEERFFFDLEYACCIYYKIQEAEHHIDYYGLKDCEIVEITIAEGDLEHQLAENQNQKAIECLKEVREKYKWYLSNYKSEDKIIVRETLNKINYIIDTTIKELKEKVVEE